MWLLTRCRAAERGLKCSSMWSSLLLGRRVRHRETRLRLKDEPLIIREGLEIVQRDTQDCESNGQRRYASGARFARLRHYCQLIILISQETLRLTL